MPVKYSTRSTRSPTTRPGAAQALNDLIVDALGVDSKAVVATTQEGGGGRDEIQVLTIEHVFADTFSLIFGDEETDILPFGAPDTGSGSAEEALENLDGITDVTVSKAVVGGKDEYTITFENSGNTDVPELQPRVHLLSFDPTSGVLDFDLGFRKGVELARPFNLDLADAGLPSVFTDLVGLSASGNLAVGADVNFDVKLGLDLADTDEIVGDERGFFIDVNNTGISASASASGENLEFNAQLGPFGLFVIDASAALAGQIDLSLLDPEGTGRLVLVGAHGSGVDVDDGTDLDNLGSFVDASSITITETASPCPDPAPSDTAVFACASLPLFFGTEDFPIPLGSPPSENVIEVDFDLRELVNGTGGVDFALPTFNFNDLANNLPGLFTLLANPAVTIDGLDRLLLTIQDALNGQIFGVDLPLIGDLLADNPVTNLIGDFRDDLLRPLAHTIRENNLNIDGLVNLIKNTIFDVFCNPGVDAGLYVWARPAPGQ